MYCNYLARQDFQNKPYIYIAGNSGCGTGGLGCSKRRTGPSPGTDSEPYLMYLGGLQEAANAAPAAKTTAKILRVLMPILADYIRVPRSCHAFVGGARCALTNSTTPGMTERMMMAKIT